ncbi:ArnT family glycosyltransferase [Alicyclobacillus fodiniaquatilis]|uniref:ArnT family glycosyltransferase n=1 Tax=Alicyclobacillus fodiniaquatilis TaxID=1661150 RepID=A0ABW4JQR9_9BACL
MATSKKKKPFFLWRHNLVWYVALFVFLSENVVGYYYDVHVVFYHSDGISRVANAFYVLYSRDPHLGAIGFVWNPLPSVIDLLFLSLYHWIPAMATKGIAGLLMSSIFAALTAGLLARAFLQRGLPKWSAVVFPLLFSLNPMVFLFGFNGMSDAPFVFFTILCMISFLNWLDEDQLGDLIVAGFALAFAFWCRYEAVPFGVSIFVSCVIVTAAIHKSQKPPTERLFRYRWNRAEGTLMVIATPLIYSVIAWVLLNAMIMKNPLYFLNSDYSNTAQIQGHLSNPVYAAMVHHPLSAVVYALKKVAVFSVPLFAILLLRLFNRRFFRWDTVILLGVFFSIPMLQILMLYKGTTLAWLRYFMYVLPVSVAWLPYELSKLKRRWQMSLPLAAMVVNFALLSYVITQPAIAPDENTFLQNTFGHHNQTYVEEHQQIQIAHDLDKEVPNATILADSFSAYLIILESRYPRRFYITSDFGFKDAISNPKLYGVQYILIPKPGDPSVISAINNAYPNLYAHGASWGTLVKQFPGDWRLYRVIKSTGVNAR